MTPPIKELLPRLTPVLKNRHEKVQENCIDLVGRIADRGASFVPAREWMRICFELLEMLRAHKKAIRRASVNTFGYIAKAIGPQVGIIQLSVWAQPYLYSVHEGNPDMDLLLSSPLQQPSLQTSLLLMPLFS